MYVHVCTSSCVYEACMYAFYLIAVETKMYLSMLHMEKQGPSKDQVWTKQGTSMDTQEKRENFDLSVGLTVDTWELLSRE